MAHSSTKHSMPHLMISLAMLYQPTRPPAPTVVHNQLGKHYISNTPIYRPAVVVLAGKLLAIGGKATSGGPGGADMKEVYMFSPSTNSWIYISDLPAPRSRTAVAVLSSTEVLVIGGYDSGRYVHVNTVYKGILHQQLIIIITIINFFIPKSVQSTHVHEQLLLLLLL